MHKIEQARQYGEQLIREHGLDWGFEVTSHRKTIAQANHTKKKINVSRFFIKTATLEDFKGVVLHELAHALLGTGYGHGEEFMNKCKEIGGFAVVQKRYDIMLYYAICSTCGQEGSTNIKKDVLCGLCTRKEVYTIMTKGKNKINEVEW